MIKALMVSVYIGLLLASLYMALEVGGGKIIQHKKEVAESASNNSK